MIQCAGLSEVAGKLFRIGHLGDDQLMCLAAITSSETAMRDIGITVKPGSGAAAAEGYYREADAQSTARAAESQSETGQWIL